MKLSSGFIELHDRGKSYIKGMINDKFQKAEIPMKPFGYVDAKYEDWLSKQGKVAYIEDGYIGDDRRPVVKFVCNTYEDYYYVRNKLKSMKARLYETDITLSDKLIYYEKIKVEYSPSNIVFLDIEVDDSKGFPDPPGEFKIYSVAVTDYEGNVRWFYHGDYDSEAKMLRHLELYLMSAKKTIIVGYNVQFDYQHLVERYKKLGIRSIFLETCDTIDMYSLIRQNFKGLPDYKLDTVAHYFLGVGKVPREKRITEMTREELMKYNVRDATLLPEIDRVVEVVLKQIEIANTMQIPVRYLNATKLWDILIARAMHAVGMVMRIKYKFGEHVKYSGAMVKQPAFGLYFNVVDYDITSLYPSIIIDKLVDILDYRGAFLPKLLRKYFDLRQQFKKMRNKYEPGTPEYTKYDLLQWSYKIIINSAYGIFGNPGFRYYDPQKALFITQTGQNILREIMRYVEEEIGYVVRYGDSVAKDSWLLLRDKHGKIIIKTIEELFDEHYTIVPGIGGKEYVYLTGDYEALSLNTNTGRLEWKPVKYVMRHKSDKQMYRVWLTNDDYIDVTEDHSLIGYVNVLKQREYGTKYVEVKPDKLGEDIKSLIMPRFTVDDSGANELAVKVWELIGFAFGDGSWSVNPDYRNSKYYVWLSLGIDEDELVDKLIQPLVDYNIIKAYKKTDKGDWTILAKWFRSIMTHFKDDDGNRVVPEFVFGLPPVFKKAFLRGYFTADGTTIMRGGTPIVRLTTIYDSVAVEIHKLLMSIGIPSVYFRENSENSYNGVKSGTYSRHVYIKDVVRFKDVGFILDRKNHRICSYEYGKRSPLRKLEFSLQKVYNVEPIDYNGYVYDIEVEDNHNFFANGVLVHNTDSVFVQVPFDIDEEGAELIAEMINEHIKPYKVKVEAVFKKLLIPESSTRKGVGSKKRYIYLTTDGKLKWAGIELVRGDVPPITKTVMRRVIEMIMLENASYSAVKKYLAAVYNDVMSGKWPREEFVITKGVKDNPEEYKTTAPHIRAYEMAYNKGFRPIDGTISFVFGNGDVVPIIKESDLDNVNIDYRVYWETYIKAPIDRIVKAAYDFQSNLSRWMS